MASAMEPLGSRTVFGLGAGNFPVSRSSCWACHTYGVCSSAQIGGLLAGATCVWLWLVGRMNVLGLKELVQVAVGVAALLLTDAYALTLSL